MEIYWSMIKVSEAIVTIRKVSLATERRLGRFYLYDSLDPHVLETESEKINNGIHWL